MADKLVEMRKKADHWKVIDELVNAWSQKTPEEFHAYKVYIDDTRNVQIDPKFGQTKDKTQDRRLKLVFPQSLMQMIRAVYKPQDLAMDKKFFDEFARRYPFFKIPEKL